MTPKRIPAIALTALLAAAPLLGGCQAIFVVLEKMFPKERVPALV